MIRRDYIVRMIEEFIQALARIDALKKGQLWREAEVAIDTEFQRLVKAGGATVAAMSETELLARIIHPDLIGKSFEADGVFQKVDTDLLKGILREDQDYVFDKGLMVFTSSYLKRRGYCCDNGCRNCPY